MMDNTTHISTSGGLLSAAFIENIRQVASRQRGIEPESFALGDHPGPKNAEALEATIAAAWELLCERWDAIHAQLPLFDLPQARTRWLIPLFQLLDFEPQYQRADLVLGEADSLRFPLSYRGWPASRGPGAPILHTVAPSQDLDARSAAGRGARARSPHDLLQAFLNLSPEDHWAVLTNGLTLRLLRDYHHTFTSGYVQFDLESIFESRNYGDFRALYRLCHASRFVTPAGAPAAEGEEGEAAEALCPLERFYKDSLASGIRVGKDLRGQVRLAIETLANGFLDGELVARLSADAALCQAYWSEILHLVYRLLFLLFAEQRGMLPRAGAPLEGLYRAHYSITALRTLAENGLAGDDEHADLWAGLLVTFRMLREGAPELGVYAYDGMLFADTPIGSLLEGRRLANAALLAAVRSLTLIERAGVLQRISYADLGVEELGSIYESLLDYTPRITRTAEVVDGRPAPANAFVLDPHGTSRKTTCSYYTHPSLVNELIKSALLPVVRERLAEAGLPVIPEEQIGEGTRGLLAQAAALSPEQRRAGEEALLSIRVCDPAAGSGHFLVRANNVLAAELARLRTGDEYPPESAVYAARRDVLAHCIYAVDLNPMAVELCKVSLWINAAVPDRPLSFLDHHIQCGNSLLGATPEAMQDGIPDEAFDPGITGNDAAVARALRRRNREENDGQLPLVGPITVLETMEDLERWSHLSDLAEDDPQRASAEFRRMTEEKQQRQLKQTADLWTAAFFWPLGKGADWAPTHAAWERVRLQGERALPRAAAETLARLAARYRFFHWHLAFPEVFAPRKGAPEGAAGGFDVVLGNPPWERIKLQEKEFFGAHDPEVAAAPTADERGKRIKNLAKSNPELYAAYEAALRDSEAAAHFLRDAGRFPLVSGGDINTYAVFAGLARRLLGPRGRAGIVVPSGIATDYTYREFFADVFEHGNLVSLYDFENRRKLFADVHSRFKFCLLTLTGGSVPQALFAFFLWDTADLADPQRRFPLSKDDLALFNPNTRTCPIFRSRRDAELTRKLYRAAPVLVNERTGENPWGISFVAMFHMANDSHLFRTREQLEGQGYVLQGNRFVRGKDVYLPLYEAKMFWHYDHRFGTYEGVTSRSDTHLRTLTAQQHADPCFVAQPCYWVAAAEVDARLEARMRWLLGFRDITNTTNERTAIFSILPRSAVGHTAPLLLSHSATPQRRCALLANLDALPFDFIARQKMGGTHLTFFIVSQLPALSPAAYGPDTLAAIVPKVLELTYTAWDLQPFALDVLAEVGRPTWERWFAGVPVHSTPPPAGQPAFPPPFVWDEERRAHLRAELDAIYAHLYGLTREELEYILETFPIVRRKDEAKYGEYRTKRLVLEQYEAFEGRIQS